MEGSVTNHKFIDALCEAKRFTCIYHLAAYAAEGVSHFIKRFNTRTISSAAANLAQIVAKAMGCTPDIRYVEARK